ETIPAAESGTTLRVYVGGVTATFADFATVVNAKLPWFILAIIGLSFLLLVLAFRSLLIPATAAVMNLLAAAASFGVLTAFFQWGWGTDAFGLGKAGPVEAFLPVVPPPADGHRAPGARTDLAGPSPRDPLTRCGGRATHARRTGWRSAGFRRHQGLCALPEQVPPPVPIKDLFEGRRRRENPGR